MKEVIIGYITGRIDGHLQAADRDKRFSNLNFQYHTDAAKELEEVLNYIIDIPERENLPERHNGQGSKNITLNMVNPEDLPPEVKKILETIAKQQFYK